MFISIRT